MAGRVPKPRIITSIPDTDDAERPSPLPLPALPERLGDHRRWRGMPGAALAIALAETAAAHPGATVAVVSGNQRVASLARELGFFLGPDSDLDVLAFPDTETLPYDIFSTTPDIVSQRFGALYRLDSLSRGIVITSLPNLLRRLAPVDYLHARCLALEVGQDCDPIALRDRLERGGYTRADTVRAPGEFALRGGLIDVFAMGAEAPCRVDLLDERIDSLRLFDPDSQRTTARTGALRALPTLDYPLDAEAITRFRGRWHRRFDSNPDYCRAYQDISDGRPSPGAECYMPLFFETTASWFDYLPEGSLAFVVDEDIEPACQKLWSEIVERRRSQHSIARPLLDVTELFLTPDAVFAELKQRPQVRRQDASQAGGARRRASADLGAVPAPELQVDHLKKRPLAAFDDFRQRHADAAILLCAVSSGREQALAELFESGGIAVARCDGWQDFLRRADNGPGVFTAISPLERGALLPGGPALLTETELFGHRPAPVAAPVGGARAGAVIKSLAELKPGAPVVHIEHGVGRYQGLRTLPTEGVEDEYLCLEYANAVKLFVPVSSIDLVTRYSGPDDVEAPLHALGNAQWQKSRRKAAEDIRDVSAKLLSLHAERLAHDGIACKAPERYARFAAECPFALTEDQQTAVDSVLADMQRSMPMDRLVSGDVGFGKTEVAMRAAYVAVANGLQVAVLAPTTLLAQQHYESFCDRFAGHQTRIAALSRFRNKEEQRRITAAVADGDVDIVIGTHSLLQPNIRFAALGLIVVDEEHRFGVHHKSRLRAARSQADCLSLTATPIPRTLHNALEGLTELSIIATPPPGRMPIKTFVTEFDEDLVREALSREALRGGQSYYLHNNVRSIHRRALELAKWMPDLRIDVAHGQMGARQLADAMDGFYRRRTDVLVCSTIIESGIDASNANTIIIDRADKLGLAQLHQLRGRVGRGDRQAYAWLLAPPSESISHDARHRLNAIAKTADLGIGFHLACHDMEIRGVGNLLGNEQSGQVHAIGLSAYTKMLRHAVNAIRAGQLPSSEQMLRAEQAINLRVPLRIPDDYLPDVNARLVLYQRINEADDDSALNALADEMTDRFGAVPASARRLFDVARLKLVAAPLGLERIEAHAEGGVLVFGADTPVEPATVLALVQKQPQHYYMPDGRRLALRAELADPDRRVARMRALIDVLVADINAPFDPHAPKGAPATATVAAPA